MLRTDGVKRQLSGQFEASRGERPLLSPLSPKTQVALMCRRLSREDWNEHIAGHTTGRRYGTDQFVGVVLGREAFQRYHYHQRRRHGARQQVEHKADDGPEYADPQAASRDQRSHP